MSSASMRAIRPLEASSTPAFKDATKPWRSVIAADPQALVVDAAQHEKGVVGRRVVDHDELDIGERLTENALDRVADGAAGVEDRQHDTHERRTPGSDHAAPARIRRRRGTSTGAA